jgi:hypothetical protein
MLKALWIIVARISGFLIPTVVGSAFFFAIIGVFGLWIAIAGLILAIAFAVTTVAFVPAEWSLLVFSLANRPRPRMDRDPARLRHA